MVAYREADDQDELERLFYEADVWKHRHLVAELMVKASIILLGAGVVHDASKLTDKERPYYEKPVWALNHSGVEYGSPEYKRLTAQMGQGWEHHKAANAHHPEFYGQEPEALSMMNMFEMIEMLCDWIAASKRKGNDPAQAMKFLKEKYPVSEQLEKILLNTLVVLR